MQNKRHVCKESRQHKRQAAACLCFLNYLYFLRPALDRSDRELLWVESQGHAYVFFWPDSIIQEGEEGD
jgi:hypothetical protein